MSSPDIEIYPDEQAKLALAMTKLSNAFEFSSFSESTKAIFESAAREELGKLGFTAAVTWQQVYEQKSDTDPEVPTGVWLPGVEITGRVMREAETDHDRVRWGVVRGLADGQPGYVREDGRKTEDPIKKLII